jgi:hypothetical protein
MPLYKLLKKSDHFEWTQEAQEALTRLKDFLTTPPVLISPLAGETLLLYTATMPHTVNVTLVVEHEEGHVLKVQRPMYFVSAVLFDSKARYPRIQMLLYAVLIAKHKRWHYFNSHPMVSCLLAAWGISSTTRSPPATSPSGGSSSWASTSPTPPHHNQVLSPHRLHHGVDRGTGLDRPYQGRVLNHLLRWLPHP